MSIMVDIKNSFISHLLDVETWPMTNGRNDLPFAMKSYTSWLMVDLDLPFSIWCFHNLAYGRCIFHVPVYHLPVEVRVYHLPMMKNMISTMCHLPSVYAPPLLLPRGRSPAILKYETLLTAPSFCPMQSAVFHHLWSPSGQECFEIARWPRSPIRFKIQFCIGLSLVQK